MIWLAIGTILVYKLHFLLNLGLYIRYCIYRSRHAAPHITISVFYERHLSTMAESCTACPLEMANQAYQQQSLAYMPPAIAIAIFRQLLSFSDVFALATTFRFLHKVWHDNAKHIFQQLASCEIGIGFLPLACSLLANQRGASAHAAQLSVYNIRRYGPQCLQGR